MEPTVAERAKGAASCLLWIAPALREFWPEEPAAAYEAWTQLSASDNQHQKQGRSTGRYVIAGSTQNLAVYIKRYFRLSWWQRWLVPLARFPGPLEMKRLEQVRRLGIPLPEVVAAGADRRHECRSFLAVRELEGFVELHKHLTWRFGRAVGSVDAAQKRALARRIADIARRLHGAQLYHLDFYLCHFLIREDAEAVDGFELALIDFLRLKHSSRRRWLTKDLAQLLFSSYMPGITRTDRLRFWKHYLGVRRLDAEARRQLRAIVAKADRYHKHNADGSRFTKFD